MRSLDPGDLSTWRRARRFGSKTSPARDEAEFRTQYERDRDRLLYSASLRRLAVVTQVLSPTEGFAGHNRLTHALKVSQVARRLAEKLCRKHNEEFVDLLGGLNPDVAECAGLAHDLGHPPFGHVAEEELSRVVIQNGVQDGFEGNAQSFRIVTKLEIRQPNAPGLDLTRASLGAILKYPWLKGKGPKADKYGAYQTEQEDFDFARQDLDGTDPTVEAQVMDWADDITYSAHDLEDFYRAGRIPLHTLTKQEKEREEFLKSFFKKKDIDSSSKQAEWKTLFDRLALQFPVTEAYSGNRTQKSALRAYVSSRIQRAMDTTTLNGAGLLRDEEVEREVELLKHLTMHYVILTPSLKAQQHGHREIISGLFSYYLEQSADKNRWPLFPTMFQQQLAEYAGDDAQRIRSVADLIAGMGEVQAVEAYRSISNVSWSLY